MASAEQNRPNRSDSGTQRPAAPDIVLSAEDLDDLIEGVSRAFFRSADAARLLRRIGFPDDRVPNFDPDHRHAWNEVFYDLREGVIEAPYRRILLAALRVYGSNATLLSLAQRHGLVPGAPVDPSPEPLAPTCHVIIRANSEDERQHAHRVLRSLGLPPEQEYATSHAVSFRVGSPDVEDVRRRLDGTTLGWTVVPPGAPDYLLQSVFVEGPDRRQFQVTDAPAQQTVRNLATEVIMDHYPQADTNAELPITVDHVQQDGQPRRVDVDDTLHDAGVRDGDSVRVAYQTNAGSVNPLDRQDALYRVRNQLRDYANSRTGFEVRANSALLPTGYELAFSQLSFGPGPHEGDDPVEIENHEVEIELPPDFPREAPILWWLTPIFHPNVYPNYDCERARQNPGSRGLVCLGMLGESWQPSWDFGELCQMVVDMAAFRNYALFEDTGRVDARGVRVLRGNFFDRDAAVWVRDHPERIKEIGGEITSAPRRARLEYRNVIEPVR